MSNVITFVAATLPFLWQGLMMTLFVSLAVVGLSLVAGVLIGIAFAYGRWWLALPLRAFSDIMRGTPLLVVIFTIYYLLPFAGINLQPLPSVLLALALFKTAHVG